MTPDDIPGLELLPKPDRAAITALYYAAEKVVGRHESAVLAPDDPALRALADAVSNFEMLFAI